MDERVLVFDTLAGQQTPGRHERPVEERRREYYPFKPYCPVCGTDNTRVTGYRRRDGPATSAAAATPAR